MLQRLLYDVLIKEVSIAQCHVPSSNSILFTVGMELPINFKHCQCEMLPVALIRARLWPASPHSPVLCFSFELMDWVEALLLECQVALKNFCRALYFQCPYRLKQVGVMSSICWLYKFMIIDAQRRDIYAALIDSFEEYR